MRSLRSNPWKEITFGEIVEHSAFGPRFSADAYSDSGNIFTLRTTDISQDGRIEYRSMPRAQLDERKFSKHFLSPGDLVISRSGRIGTTAVFDGSSEPVLPGAFLIRFRLRKAANPRFFRYWFNSNLGQQGLRSIARGAAQQNISATNVLGLTVPLPDLPAQERVVSLLSAYDDLIENNRRRIQLLEQAARLLYKEWFVHLRFPGHEHVSVVEGVPEGWRLRKIADLMKDGAVELQTGPFGTQLKAADYSETGTAVINVRNVGYGEIRPEKLEFLAEEKVMKLAKHVLRAGDVVFGRKGAVDRHALVGPAHDGWVQGSDCIRMRISGREVTPRLVSLAFREDRHKRWMLSQCGNKATMASLNQKVISRIPLLIPPHKILAMFDDHVSHEFSQIALLQRQSDAATRARDLLLPRLMNGEIPV